MRKKCLTGVLAAVFLSLGLTGCGNKDAAAEREEFHLEQFGENVYIFSPEDDPAEVQQVLDTIWRRQETNQFGDERYALYFLPGEYSEEIDVKVGFYTQAAGLGTYPDDVLLNRLNCDARWLGDDNNHNATCNFWRGVENLSVKENVMWAVSQATFMRRVHLNGALYLHDNYGWCSGGFLANARVELLTDSGTQQQWLSRNCSWKKWMGQNWNMVFAGIEEGKTPTGTWPVFQYTDVPEVEIIREKPFLAYDEEKGFGVYVPEERTDAVDVDWAPGEWISMKDFYIAKADTDTAETINAALQSGKHLFLTPGVYELEEPIIADREGTIVLGSGLATLRSMKGQACVEVKGDVKVTLAGILFDAGPEETESLLTVGEDRTGTDGNESGPRTEAASGAGHTLLADLFFRVGGAINYGTDVRCCVNLHQDGIIGDNFWVWRADHGDGVGWYKNKAVNGIRVTGDDVTIYALMVEHFQEYQTIWEGEGGKVVFYQCEIPYDVPNQEAWRSHEGTVNGYASYKVADNVNSHEAYGLGIYLYNRDATVELRTAMEVPEAGENIRVYHICTVMITGNPGITHIINEEGGSVYTAGAREVIIDYPLKD